MKRMRIMGLCLVAVFVVTALFAGSASARTLEYGKCNKVAEGTGVYGDGGCVKPGGKKNHEWAPASPTNKFKLTSLKIKETGNAVLESVSKTQIACAEQKSTDGEISNLQEVKDIIGKFGPKKLKATEPGGCEALTKKCNSAGKAAGFIDTLKLAGSPGIIKKEASPLKDIVGNELHGQTSEFLAEFECAGAPVKVKGGVITELVKKNKTLGAATIEFVAKEGKQIPEKFDCNANGEKCGAMPNEFLESKIAEGTYEQSGQTLITKQKSSPKSELRDFTP